MKSLEAILSDLPSSQEEYLAFVKNKFQINTINDLNNCIIFGSANMGRLLLGSLNQNSVTIKAFSDNNPKAWGKTIQGVPVIAPTQISQNDTVVIASKYVAEINNQLQQLNINHIIPFFVISTLFPTLLTEVNHTPIQLPLLDDQKQQIRHVYQSLKDDCSKRIFSTIFKFKQTFDMSFLPLITDNEYFPDFWINTPQSTFIDIGAFTGDTLQEFLLRSKGAFKQYVAFEPDHANFQQLLKTIPKKYNHKILPIQACVGDDAKQVFISGAGTLHAKVSKQGTQSVSMIRLDDQSFDFPVSTIKADVEGAEPLVLSGAKQLIKTQTPNLAICVYHQFEHLWTLAKQILSYVPDYDLYLRHHEPLLFGTVLYASKKNR